MSTYARLTVICDAAYSLQAIEKKSAEEGASASKEKKSLEKSVAKLTNTVGTIGKGLNKVKSNTRTMTVKQKALVADVRQQLAEMKSALKEQMGLTFVAKLKVIDFT